MDEIYKLILTLLRLGEGKIYPGQKNATNLTRPKNGYKSRAQKWLWLFIAENCFFDINIFMNSKLTGEGDDEDVKKKALHFSDINSDFWA